LGTESPPSQSASVSFSDQAGIVRVESQPGDEEVRNQTLCKDTSTTGLPFLSSLLQSTLMVSCNHNKS